MLQSVFLLVLLGTAVSSQQQHEDKHQEREVEPTQRGQPLEQPASQDEQHPTELRPAPQENERPQLPDGENEPPPPPPSPQSQPQPQQENQQHQGTIDEEQRQREERLLGEQEQQPPSLEPMPDALPSQADHQQQPTMQSQKDSEHQHSGGDSRAVDLPHPEEQTEGEEDQHQSKTKTVEGQEGGLLQQESQEEGEAEEVKEAGMRKEEVMEEEMIEEEVKEEGVEEEEMREEGEETEDTWSLPSDLPTLHWHETARLIKCCPPEEALVHRPGGGPPACEPSPSAERWQPLLLNGRSGRRTPPDACSQLASGNLSCSGQHFWLDSTAGDGFELLTTGHLYLRRADALMAPLSFCADRLFRYTEEAEGVTEPPPARVGRAARVCTLSLQERRSLLDETALMPVCARRTCLRKCCPRGLKVRWREDQLCVPQTGARPWRPEFQPGAGPPPDYHTVSGNPPCRAADGTLGKVFTLQPVYYDDEKFLLREDGRLWVPHSDTTVDLEDFCVDQVEYEHPQQPGVLVDYHAAIVCFPEADGGTVRVSAATYVYRALVLVSALFLLVTLVVYCSVPELRNLHGRCLLSHVAALLAAYSCNLAAQLAPVYSNMAACQIIALVMYFSFLAACFWLNVMSFDIWLTFSRIRSAAPNRSQTGRFIKYSLYCWCCPLVLTAVVIVMQFVPDHLVPPENFIRPRLGELKCWFAGGLEMLVYFHVPLLLLMTANLVFFTLTIKNLLQTEKDTRMAGRQKKGIERFKIYVNIFIVMGVTWIVEALSVHIGPKELWSVTDVFNALQGFFIFLLFTLRQNTRNIIRKHFAGSALCRCCPRAVQPPGSVGTSSRKTRSTSVPSGEGDSFRHHSRRTAGEGAGPAERAAAGTPLSPVRETAALCDESETEHASPANGRSE